jgi:hypothetical protein
MKSIRLIVSIILGISSFVIGQTFFHRGTLWYYFFMLLYVLFVAFFSYELKNKLGIKKVKKPVKIRILSCVVAAFVIAGFVFGIESLLNVDKSIIKWSIVATFFISGILIFVYSIYILKKNKQ